MHKVGASVVFCLLAIAWPSAAQNAPVAAPPGPTIRVTTTEVALDMVVRDKKGKIVKNLKPNEVEIYEDGVRQDVRSFRLVVNREEQHRRVEKEQPVAEPATKAMALPEVNALCIVFHNIDPTTRPHAVEIVKEFLKSDLPPETYIALFTLNERLIPMHAFTKDREELVRTIDASFQGRGLDFDRASAALLTASPNLVTIAATVNNATHSASVNMNITGGEISNAVITGADVDNGPGANRQRGDQVMERSDFANITGMHETDRIITMIDDIGKLPGRKTVLLVTTGLVTTGDPDRFQKILNNANKHGITFYALDSTEMSATNDTTQAGKQALAQMASVSAQQTNLHNSAAQMKLSSRQGDDTIAAVRTSDTQASLRALSEGTGGFLIANTNDFRKSFQQLTENLDAHYELDYHPTITKFDGRLRKIEVKLSRPDWTVESRTGYFAMPDLKDGALTPEELTGLAVLNAQTPPHAFDFRVQSFSFAGTGPGARATLAFQLPGAKLGATPEPERRAHKVEVSLFALVRDANGQVVDKYSVDTPYTIPDAQLAAVRATALTYTHPLELPPGHYTVDTALVDREGGQATTNNTAIDVPAPSKGVGISSLVAVQEIASAGPKADNEDPLTFKGRHVVPLVDPVVNPAQKRYIYFVVYPDKSNAEKPKIHVEFRNAGQVFAQSTVDLPAPDASGTIPMFVAAATRPGDCELQITAEQGKESATSQLKYAVTAN
ncbi:MAG TPA: VWA domain-containing protein [Bryobacteraceae bacterium]|nr:VWA domain-containing protein [Bryobacteraceae bacterium]